MQNVNKILLKRSAALSGGTAKQPSAQDIESGELAMNYADGHESLFIKNSNNEIVKFSSDAVYTSEKLGDRFSATTVQEVIEDNEEVVAAALADLSNDIAGKADINHTHPMSDVQGLPAALAGKTDNTVFTAHTGDTVAHVTSTEKNTWNSKLSGVTFNTTAATVTNGVAAITATLDGISDGTTRKLSNYATTGTVQNLNNVVTAHTANTTVHITSEERAKINNALSGLSFTDGMADVTISNGNASVDLNLPNSLRIMGITPSGHTLADAADSYYTDSLGDEEVGAWFISYSNGSILLPSDDTSKDQSGRVALSDSWESRLNYGGMTWANVGDILLVYKGAISVYKVLSINEAGETRIGLMSPNDKKQVNKISNLETNVNNLNATINKRLPYSTDSTNIGNVGDGAYSNVTAGRDNWLDTSSGGAAIKLSPLQIGVDPSGRLYSRNTTKSAIWNLTNQLVTIGGTDLDTVHEPSVVGYGVCTNGPSENPLTVYTFASSDIDNNGYRSLLQIAIDRNTSAPYVRTTFYQPNGGGFSKTDWVQVTDDYNNLKNKPELNFVTTATFNAHTADTTVHVTTAQTQAWNDKISAVKVNDNPLTPDANKAVNITVPTALSALTADASHRTVSDTEKATWNDKVNTADIANFFDDVEYDSANKRINFKHGTTVKDYIDATAFIKDGMVDTVTVSGVPSGSSTVQCLVVTFNTDAGKEAIKIPLDDIFDPSNYYTKTEVDTALSTKTDNTAFTAHTGDSAMHVTSTEKNTWNGKQDAFTNANVLAGITTEKVTNWDNAATNSHSHANKGVLDNLTQDVINNSHTHANKSVLDGIDSTDITKWDGVTAKTDTSAFTAHSSNTTVHVTTADRNRWNAVSGKTDTSDFTAHTTNTDIHVTTAQTNAWDNKQDALTFDEIPTSGSTNPVKSGGVYKVITENELITAGALNKLQEEKQDVLPNASVLSGIGSSNITYWNTVSGKTNQSDFTAHTANTSIHVTSADKTEWDGKISGVQLNGSGLTPDANHIVNIPLQEFDYDEIPTSGSTNLVNSGDLYEVIRETELIISNSLNDLDRRIQIVSGQIENSDFELDNVPTRASSKLVNSGSLYEVFADLELGISAALNDLDTRIKVISGTTPEVEIEIDPSLDAGSRNPVANSAVTRALTSHTSDATVHVSSTERTTWNNKQDALPNASVLTGITAPKVSSWDQAVTDLATLSGDVEDTEYAIATALNDLNTRIGAVEGGGGSGDVNVIESVQVNGTALTPNANKAVNITSIPASIVATSTTQQFASATEKTKWNAVTGKTNQSDFTTHTGNADIHVTAVQKQTWDNAASSAHSHVNKTVLDGITTAKTAHWDEAYNRVSGATWNGTEVPTYNTGRTLNFTVTLDNVGDGTSRKLSDYMHKTGDTTSSVQITTTGATGSVNVGGFLVTVAQGDTTGFAVQGKIGSDPSETAIISAATTSSGARVSLGSRGGYSDNDAIWLNGRVQGMVVGSTSRLLQANVPATGASTNQAYDLVANTIAKGTFNTSTKKWDITGEFAALPSFTAADNGKILGIVNGALAWVSPTTIYTGSGTPDSSQGNNGDIYLQTS